MARRVGNDSYKSAGYARACALQRTDACAGSAIRSACCSSAGVSKRVGRKQNVYVGDVCCVVTVTPCLSPPGAAPLPNDSVQTDCRATSRRSGWNRGAITKNRRRGCALVRYAVARARRWHAIRQSGKEPEQNAAARPHCQSTGSAGGRYTNHGRDRRRIYDVAECPVENVVCRGRQC